MLSAAAFEQNYTAAAARTAAWVKSVNQYRVRQK